MIGFRDIVLEKNRQTNSDKNRTPRLPSAWVVNGTALFQTIKCFDKAVRLGH